MLGEHEYVVHFNDMFDVVVANLSMVSVVMFYTPTHDEEQTVWFFVSVIFATWLMSRVWRRGLKRI